MTSPRRLLGVLAAMAIVLAGLLGAAASASAQVAPLQSPAQPPYSVIASDGFGQPDNDYAWSMAWFNGKLYVGTARSEGCIESATEAFYNTAPYSTSPNIGETCPANEYDIDTQAQIWAYTPGTNSWALVFNSPQNIPNPLDPGTFVSRDIAFRGMVVYDGALYIGDVTADEYIPELASSDPPRILRTTDGVNFTSINAPSTIDTYLGVQKPIGFRAMDEFNGNLYVTASSGLTGDGVVLEVNDPSGADPTFNQISPSNYQVFEIQPYNGWLYVGTGSALNAGYGVYKTNGSETALTWQPIVTDSLGEGAALTSVVSMGVLNNDLYVGSAGWYNTALPASEMIRIYPDDTYDLIAGPPRTYNGKTYSPLSGLSWGFGDPFNAHFWRMDVANGALNVGTNNWTYLFQDIPLLNILLYPYMGFDIYDTCDGTDWYALTYNAFGSGIDNFGARNLVDTPDGNFIGSANHAQGTDIYESTGYAPSCASSTQTVPGLSPSATAIANSTTTSTSTTATASAARASAPKAKAKPRTLVKPSLVAPAKVLTSVQACGTVVSWVPTAGAGSYEVIRQTATTVTVPALQHVLLPGGVVPDDPPAFSGGMTKMTINGPPIVIGHTTKAYYVDHHSVKGSLYEVVALPPKGKAVLASSASNIAPAPSLAEAATFANLRAALGPAAHGTTAAAASLGGGSALLDLAQARWRAGNRAGAVSTLAALNRQLDDTAFASRVGGSATLADAQDLAYRLQRNVRYAGVACLR